MRKRAKFLRVFVNDDTHIFEIAVIKSGTLNIEQPIDCPCCHQPMPCILDITQFGFFDDKFILLFACADCGKAFWYSYTLGAVELTELASEIVDMVEP